MLHAQEQGEAKWHAQLKSVAKNTQPVMLPSFWFTDTKDTDSGYTKSPTEWLDCTHLWQ